MGNEPGDTSETWRETVDMDGRMLASWGSLVVLVLGARSDPPTPSPSPSATPTPSPSATPTATATPARPTPEADVEAVLDAEFTLAAGQSAYIPSADLLVRLQDVGTGRATIGVTQDGQDLGEMSLRTNPGGAADLGGHSILLVATPGSGAVLRVEAGAQVVSANTRFAFDLLRELRRQDGDQNMFLSPLSISMAMAMVYNGADGATKTAMEDALRLSGLGADAINAGNSALLSALANREPELVLNIANSLWARDDFTIDRQFLERVRAAFNAEVESLPFDDAALQRINAWVSEATEGKIDQILDRIDPLDVLYLINAIYFKGSWEFEFDEELTSEATFHNANGTETQVPMMHRFDGTSGYLDGVGFVAIRMGYENDASMYVFLPDKDSSLPAFMEGLTAESWAGWMPALRENKSYGKNK